MSRFSHSSLSRDLPDQRRQDTSRMGLFSSNQPLSSGFGRLGQSSGRPTSLMSLDRTSKLGPQGSHGMMPSGSSSQNVPSVFSLGSRGPPPLPSQSRDPDQASKILASFGLSSNDLDELSRYPEEKITAESLPQIIEHLRRRRAEDLALVTYRERLSQDTPRSSRDNWDDLGPLRRESVADRPSTFSPVVDYDHGNRSRELSYRETLAMDERLRDRERLREDSFLSEPPFRKLENDYDRLSSIQTQERSMFEKSRGMPSARRIDDFHGLSPKDYPHLCTLCDIPCNSIKNWKEHINGGVHKQQRLRLLDLFPEWTGHGMADPYMLQQSTNPAPGLLGPPPPAMSMRGGPDDRQRNFRSNLGNEDMSGGRQMSRPGPGQRQMPRNMKREEQPGTGRDMKGIGRVLHLSNLPQSGYTDSALLKLAEAYGKVKNYILMRMRNQAFIELERAEDAQTMINRCSKIPLIFQGRNIRVGLSQRYQKLVLRIPNAPVEKEKDSRKRVHSPNRNNVSKPKQGKSDKSEASNADQSSQVVTTEDNEPSAEEMDLVSGSCEPEFVEETEEDEATALMETSISIGDGDEVPDISDLDQKEVSEDLEEPLSSTPAAGENKGDSMEGFVTLDEVGDVEDIEEKLEFSEIAENETTKAGLIVTASTSPEDTLTGVNRAPDSDTTTEIQITDYELGPYQSDNPVGVNYVIPKTGYYCKLCSLFYTCEEMAKVTHCSSLPHYQKLKKLLNKAAKTSKKKN